MKVASMLCLILAVASQLVWSGSAMHPPKRQAAACNEEKEEGGRAWMRDLRQQAIEVGFLLVNTDCDGVCMFRAVGYGIQHRHNVEYTPQQMRERRVA